MHLSLSPDEYRRLLTLASLGEIVMNDWTTDQDLTDEQRAMGDTLADLCARAEGSPAEALTERDEHTGEWTLSPMMRERVDALMASYDNDVFWDEIVHRFARRDLQTEYGAETIGTMADHYRAQAEQPLLDYWWREVRDNGINRLQVVDESADRSARRRNERTPRKRERPGAADAEDEGQMLA
jgi:hypothetical protein